MTNCIFRKSNLNCCSEDGDNNKSELESCYIIYSSIFIMDCFFNPCFESPKSYPYAAVDWITDEYHIPLCIPQL